MVIRGHMAGFSEHLIGQGMIADIQKDENIPVPYGLADHAFALSAAEARAFRLNQETVRKAAPYVIVVLVGLLSSAVTKKKKQQGGGAEDRRGSQSYAGTRRGGSTAAAFSGGKALTEDQKKRLRHLDEWLESGLIDRAEYKVLKERYERNR